MANYSERLLQRIKPKPMIKPLACFFASILLTGCQLTKDVTLNPEGRTDFVAGQTYQIMQPVFLWKSNKLDSKETPMLAKLGFSGSSSNLDEFRREEPNSSQAVGLLTHGDRVRVVKFVENKVPTLGTFFNVYAVVLSGTAQGTVVKLNLISKEARPTFKAFLDPEYLEPVKPWFIGSVNGGSLD